MMMLMLMLMLMLILMMMMMMVMMMMMMMMMVYIARAVVLLNVLAGGKGSRRRNQKLMINIVCFSPDIHIIVSA